MCTPEPPFAKAASGQWAPRVTKNTHGAPPRMKGNAADLPGNCARGGQGSSQGTPADWQNPVWGPPFLPVPRAPSDLSSPPHCSCACAPGWLGSSGFDRWACHPVKECSGGKPAHRFAEHPLEARKLERDSWDGVLTILIMLGTMAVAGRLAGKCNGV